MVSRAAVSLETFASISLAAMEVQGAGVVTRAAEPGSEVREGDPVLEVDARPVFLLRGERPAYRAIAAGDFGPDVSQLQQALNRLGIGGTPNTGVFDEATGRAVLYLRSGYLPATGKDWSPATLTRLRNLAAAVADSDDPSCRPPDTRLSCPLVTEAARLYQAQTGLRIPFGEIAFAPQGPPLAVGGVPPPRGGSVYEAELDLASAEPVVLVALSPFDAGRVSVGSRAVLDDDPEGRTASGAVTDLWAPEDVPEYGGTSTLARVVLEEGGTELLGRSMTGAAERERSRLRAARIGFVFQAFHLVDHLTAEENVRLGMTYGIVPRRERSRRARMMLEQVGLGGREESLPGQLSAGQQQRTAVARALVSGCRLLLCDEPTGNLDGTSTAVVLDLLDRLREGQEMTVVTATHDPLVSARADRVVRVADGRVDAT